jgi:hypothetical protein
MSGKLPSSVCSSRTASSRCREVRTAVSPKPMSSASSCKIATSASSNASRSPA